MKKLLIALGIGCSYAAASHADCEDLGYTTQLRNNPSPFIANTLSGARIEAIAPDGEEWNEDHCTSGALYKVGTDLGPPKYPDRPSVDPRAFRGTWATAGMGANSTVVYTYGDPSGPYAWRLYQDAGGGLCWQENMNNGSVIATAPAPGAAGTPCNIP